jgi:hypothetical protein
MLSVIMILCCYDKYYTGNIIWSIVMLSDIKLYVIILIVIMHCCFVHIKLIVDILSVFLL